METLDATQGRLCVVAADVVVEIAERRQTLVELAARNSIVDVVDGDMVVGTVVDGAADGVGVGYRAKATTRTAVIAGLAVVAAGRSAGTATAATMPTYLHGGARPAHSLMKKRD